MIDLLVGFDLKWIKVLSDGSLKKERLLRNECNILSQQVKTKVFEVLAVDDDLTFTQITESEKCLND